MKTSALSQWHVPQAHFLEHWATPAPPTAPTAFIQPMILPLFGGLSDLDVLTLLLGQEPTDKPDLVRDTFNEIPHPPPPLRRAIPRSFERLPARRFPTRHRRGGNPGSHGPRPASRLISAPMCTSSSRPRAGTGDIEVVLISDYKVDFRRPLRQQWMLQEMPHPITKLTWDNAAILSPVTARRLASRHRRHDRNRGRRPQDQGSGDGRARHGR